MRTNTLLFEMRHAWRRLTRSPGFFAAAMLMLSMGLGLTIFMFGGIKAYFLAELPYPQPQQLYHVELQDPATGRDSVEVPQPLFHAWRQQPLPTDSLAAFHLGTVNLSGDERAERYDGAFVTANAFATLGVRPMLGRGFMPQDAVAGAPAVVVIGHSLWLNRFLGDPDIIGRSVRVNAAPATVIGVMPENFLFPFQQQVWLPLIDDADAHAYGAAPGLEVFARLPAGTGPAAFDDALAVALGNLAATLPEDMRQLRPLVKPYADEYVSKDAKRIVGTLSMCVLFVLFIACVNVASLMIARSIRYQRETAIRGALGASRSRLVASVLLEALMVSIVAGGIGLLFADQGTTAINRYFASVDDLPPHWVDMSFDWRVGTFAAAISFVVALIAGFAPALRAGRTRLSNELKEGGGGNSAGRTSRGIRFLVGAELAVSCILLVSTGLMLRSVVNALDVDIGADIDNVLTGRIGLFDEAYPDAADRRRFLDNLSRELSAIPGAKGTAIATGMPAALSGAMSVRPEGVEDPVTTFNGNWSRYLAVTPGYFDLFAIALREGRHFSAMDDARHPAVAVVTQAFVDEYLPGEPALGKRIWLEEEARWVSIVGVAGNVIQDEDDIDEPPQPVLFVPVAQTDYRFFSFALKTTENPQLFQEQVRAAVRRVDADMAVYWLRTLDDWIRIGTSGQHLLSTLLGIFTFFAILLAGGGLYAVLAYAVNQRTREIGVRRALGADDANVTWLFLRECVVQLAAALAIGLLLAAGFAQLLASEFVGVSGFDPLTYLVVVLVLLLLVIVASFVPTRRALRVQPQEALRYE